MNRDLRGQFVFLAASYPSREFKDLADSQEIASAVKALLGTVFHANGKILFGGHPSISPLVLMMAREFGQRGRIVIYQSHVFDGSLSEATLRLREEGYGELILTDVDETERRFLTATPDPRDFPKSLTIMREAMLSPITDPVAAVFIGGDTGLLQEQTVFSEKILGAPVYAVGAPGGASHEIAGAVVKKEFSAIRAKLATSRNYLALMQDVVADIEEHIKAREAGG